MNKRFAIAALTAAQVASECTVEFKDWYGAIAKSYINGNPDDIAETFVFTREGDEKYCTLGTESKKNCYKKVGNTLVHLEHGDSVKATIHANGDLTWSHGPYTSSIIDNCPEAGECTLNTWKSLVGQKMRSWHSPDETKTSVETFDFVFENGQYCTVGTKSNRNCYKQDGQRLVHEHMPWVSSSLKADGTIVWSHGYRSAPVEGDCKVDVVVYEDPYQPTCEINMDSWEGSYSWSFKTGGNPAKVANEELFSRVEPDKWCANTTKVGYVCMQQVGNQFLFDDKKTKITGDLQPNGDIKWTHGYTTRLWNPCKVSSCNASFEDMDGLTFKTWHAWDAHRKTVDNFELHRRGRKFCASGDVSGMNCYYRRGNVLINDTYNWMKGRLQANGEIKWSNGYISRAEGSPCAECKVTFKDWIGKKTESYKTDDPDEKILDNWEVFEKGDQWWQKEWCIKGSRHLKGEHCMTVASETVLQNKEDNFWGWLQPDGTIEWRNGYTSRLIEDPCKKQTKAEYFDWSWSSDVFLEGTQDDSSDSDFNQ